MFGRLTRCVCVALLVLPGCDIKSAAVPRWAGPPGGAGWPSGGPTAAAAAGRWDVVTKLVAAQSAVNEEYKAGDLREERWTIAVSDGQTTLTSQVGTLPGAIVGAHFVFEGVTDTRRNLKIRVRVEGDFKSARLMEGGIKVWYHGTFDNLVGIDTWQFEGRR